MASPSGGNGGTSGRGDYRVPPTSGSGSGTRPRASSRSTSMSSTGATAARERAASSSGGPGELYAGLGGMGFPGSFGSPGTSAGRSSSMTAASHLAAQFQPRIVRGSGSTGGPSSGPVPVSAFGPPSVSSLLNSNGTGGIVSGSGLSLSLSSRPGATRTRRGSSNAASGSAIPGAPSSIPSGGMPGSRGGPSMSAGGSSALHQSLRASSYTGAIPGAPALSHAQPASLYDGSRDHPPSLALISFPLPTYLEQSSLRRFIRITPYAPSPATNTLHHGLSMPQAYDNSGRRNSTSGRQRSSSTSGRSGPVLPVSLLASVGPGGAGRRNSIIDNDSDDSSDTEFMHEARRSLVRRPSKVFGEDLDVDLPPPPPNEIIQLPTRWNKDDRSHHLSVSADGREVTYAGSSSSTDKEAASIRANYPMPVVCGVYYFEIEILNRSSRGEIRIGFCKPTVPLNTLPGTGSGESSHPDFPPVSWGYQSDNGYASESRPHGRPYGARFTISDIVGCGVDFVNQKAFFTKNGKSEGAAFEIDGDGLFPMVGLKASNDSIRANFGHAPFKYDINAYARERRNNVWRQIQQPKAYWIPSSNSFLTQKPEVPIVAPQEDLATENQTEDRQRDTRKALEDLVMDYLSYQGYSKTAEAFRADVAIRRPPPRIIPSSSSKPLSLKSSKSKSSLRNGNPPPDDDTVMSLTSTPPLPLLLSTLPPLTSVTTAGSAQDILSRHCITSAIVSGDIDVALREMQAKYPEALAADGGWLLFRFKCRKFVELALGAAAALKAAKAVQARSFAETELAHPASLGTSSSIGKTMPIGNGARRILDKGKGRSQSFDMPPPSSPRPSFAAPMPIKRSPGHGRNSLLHQPMVGEIEEEQDEDAMEIDTEDDEDHRVVQNSLLSGTPSSSSPPSSFAQIQTPPRPISSRVTSSNGNGTTSNGTGRSQPIGFNRPFIPVSTTSSPSSTPPSSFTTTNNGHAIPINIPSASSRPTISNLVAASPATQSYAVKQVSMAMSPAAQQALDLTLVYGRELHTDYGSNERPEVQDLFKRTFGLVAYESPLEAGGEVSKLAGQEDRDDLARSVNVAILASLGRRSRPMIERMYRHTSEVISYLGLTGTAIAAYADIEKEFVTNQT